MGNLDFSNSGSSNYNSVPDVQVDKKSVDESSNKENIYYNEKFAEFWGYFNDIPDLKSAIIMKSIWCMGKGYECNTETKVILEHISGWGKDTFDDVLFSLDVTRRACRDSYAEIIRDAESGILINLKSLNPEKMCHITDDTGRLIRYEQITSKGIKKFRPEQIFHLSNNRLVNQYHGISDIEGKGMKACIDAENESFTDIKGLMHHQAKPFIIFKIKCDNMTKVNALASKIDALRAAGNDLFIPDDENILSYEVVQINPSAVLLNWRDDIRNKFYRTIGLPQVVPGAGGQSTESESKVIYLAFEQIVKREQLYLEKQIWNQLHLKIKLVPPTSIMGDLSSDASKDGQGQQLSMQMNAAGVNE